MNPLHMNNCMNSFLFNGILGVECGLGLKSVESGFVLLLHYIVSLLCFSQLNFGGLLVKGFDDRVDACEFLMVKIVLLLVILDACYLFHVGIKLRIEFG